MDFGKAAALLHVAEKARQWPKLQFLHDAAMEELEAMDKASTTPSPSRMPPIEAQMRGATASTYSEQGKDEPK